jgi:Family of unknown function (DUF6308)
MTNKTSFARGFEAIPECFRDAEGEIKANLSKYFTERARRYFEKLSQTGNPCEFDGSEIAAATCLSLQFDYVKIESLMDRAQEVSDLFRSIPWDIPLWDADESLSQSGSPDPRLYELINGMNGFGPAYTSKLLAAKRPHLVPIHDSAVSNLLGNPHDWWQLWWKTIQDVQFRRLLRQLRSEVGLPHVSLLRIADVAL